MKFFEFERMMNENGVHSLAEIARALDTTPQAVSNWKARDQVPYHIEAKLRKSEGQSYKHITNERNVIFKDDSLKIVDIALTIASQIKIILIIPFIFVFLTFTYIQFIEENEYQSSAKILIAGGETQNNMGGLAGLANQFGVNLPTNSSTQSDLSNPYLLPDILRSRTFAEKILVKEFYTERYGIKLPLYKILTHGNTKSTQSFEVLITKASSTLNREYISFKSDPTSPFSSIKVTAKEPLLAKNIAENLIIELENLNRFFKSQHVRNKTNFIEERIFAVQKELEISEKKLQTFNEQNRQITSPALQLELDRLTRNVEVQERVFLTLKQQLELSKIEVIQESSIINVLDHPQIPLGPTSKNLFLRVIMSAILGIIIGLIISFSRSYAKTEASDERKKLLKTKNLFRKKISEFFQDNRIVGTISALLLLGLPFYLGYQSKSPVFFGRYSTKLMFINTVYILTLILFLVLLMINIKKNKKQLNQNESFIKDL